MEAILVIFILFVLGIVAYFLLSAAITVGVFVAMGFIALLMFGACMASINQPKEVEKYEVQHKEEKEREKKTNALDRKGDHQRPRESKAI